MPTSRLRPVAIGLTLWELWRRLPPQQRRFVLGQARTHGPKVAKRLRSSRTKRR